MVNSVALSTLCYMEKDGKYLMLHRTVKKNDVNKDKWIGVGGHFEADESPEECLLREVREETGYRLTSWRFRGIVTFVSGDGVTEYMHLFTADGFEGEPAACDEGQLEWVDIAQVWKLNIWEGDKIFFRLIDEDIPFFSLKLVYNGSGGLVSAALNGAPMELFDILNEDGTKSGLVRERGVAHRDGSLHETVHTWIVREADPAADGGMKEPEDPAGAGEKPLAEEKSLTEKKKHWEVLLQKRSRIKDSNPGCYDISSAGHLSSGDIPLEGALRELKEELGISAGEEQLQFIGTFRTQYEEVFHGEPFRDNEVISIYAYKEPVDSERLVLQESEVEEVRYFDLLKVYEEICSGSDWCCVNPKGMKVLVDYLGRKVPADRPGA